MFYAALSRCREFSANWKYIESTDNLDNPFSRRDFGIMLYDMDLRKIHKPNAMFYRAQMKRAITPDKDSEEVR